jgi:hypothetical protein
MGCSFPLSLSSSSIIPRDEKAAHKAPISLLPLPFLSPLPTSARERERERERDLAREERGRQGEREASREATADADADAAAMARLFREPRRDSSHSSSSNGFLPPAAAAASSCSSSSALPSPFPDLGVPLSPADLREAAYEVLVAASRTTGAKPLTYIPQSAGVPASSPASSSASTASSASLQRSLTSAAASKMKKALGLRSSASSKGVGSPGSGGKAAAPQRRPATVGELMRVQMRVSEPADARIRRGLLRIAASQVGSREISGGNVARNSACLVDPCLLARSYK